MNEVLQDEFPSRTLEAIKAQRKRPEYKAMVQEYLTNVNGSSMETEDPEGQLATESHWTETQQFLEDRIASYPENLTKLASEEIKVLSPNQKGVNADLSALTLIPEEVKSIRSTDKYCNLLAALISQSHQDYSSVEAIY